MTTTVLELITNLKHYPDNTVVVIRDINDVEFAIVDFLKAENTLTIVISDEAESEEELVGENDEFEDDEIYE